MSSTVRSYGVRQRKVTTTAVAQAADALFQSGTPPTVRNVRERLGGGALSTITPLLRAWWNELPSRLDRSLQTLDGPRDDVAQRVEALWLQAIEEAKIRSRHAATSGVPPATREQQALGPRRGVPPLSDTSLVIAHLERDLKEFKRLWREERVSRRLADRQADQLRAEVLRLVRVTMTFPASRRPTPAMSAPRATSERTRASSLAAPEGYKAASRKRKPTRTG